MLRLAVGGNVFLQQSLVFIVIVKKITLTHKYCHDSEGRQSGQTEKGYGLVINRGRDAWRSRGNREGELRGQGHPRTHPLA